VPAPGGWPAPGGTNSPGTPPTGGSGAPGGGTSTPGGGTTTPGTNTPSGAGAATTRRFFLPTGEPSNTAAPTVETDAQGGIHTVYPAYALGNAYYSYCADNCDNRDMVKVVRFETQGTVHNVMLALTPQGQPRVLMQTALKLYYASCDANCTTPAGWTTTMILDHMGDREVSGEAFTLDPQGNPRFIMHTYRAYLGVGQKTPLTFLVRCDSGTCNAPAAWQSDQIAAEIWEGSTLRYDATGRAHLATVVRPADGTDKMGAYLTCATGCETNAGWKGIALMKIFEHLTEAVTIKPTVAMEVTKAGGPRVVVLGKDDAGKRNIVYFECDANCSENNWQGSIISNHERIGPGLDLALDATGHPRFVYTLDYNIGLGYCDQAVCGGPNSKWDLTKIELSREIPPDTIFLEWNCTIAAWFLHDPSLALTPDGRPRVGYQARDISGGTSRPDPTKPRCSAGTDMTWSRLSLMASYKETGI
jgi:hypothetical protein